MLGDFALGRISETLPLAGTLHGRKLLLAGNHDRCWSGHGERGLTWIDRYLEAGFAEVHQGQIEIVVAGVDVLGCHFPYRGDSMVNDRFVEQRPADTGRWLLHGHVHERWRQQDRMINVGTDAWGYRPVGEDDLGQLLQAGPAQRPPRAG